MHAKGRGAFSKMVFSHACLYLQQGDAVPHTMQSRGQDIHQLDTVVIFYRCPALSTPSSGTCMQFAILPFPVSEGVLCYYYVACLGQDNLSHVTIKSYLSGVQQAQIAHGYPDPMPRAHLGGEN